MLLAGNRCLRANVGDTRAVLKRGEGVVRLSRDHKPYDQVQIRRPLVLTSIFSSTFNLRVRFRLTPVLLGRARAYPRRRRLGERRGRSHQRSDRSRALHRRLLCAPRWPLPHECIRS